MNHPKRKSLKDGNDQGWVDYPPLSERELLSLLVLLDKADLWLHCEEHLTAGLMTLAVQTYLDIDALTTVEAIADQPSRPRGLWSAIQHVRQELLVHLEQLDKSETHDAPSAQEEEQ
ncbi:hypothetical protein [Ferrimicrobium sp.]|uniref:hypothetical protein n=1 Tax=Ferrimicrobium sp. TaxID=2926050 RepID=UPI0026352612|nr:hypothetical protein [Ferrimicrobium sp.]